MIDFVILNELSYPLKMDNSKIEESLKNFIKILYELKIYDIKTIKSTLSKDEIEISEKKYMGEYIKEIKNKDLKKLALNLYNNKILEIKVPLIEESDIYSEEYKEVDFYYQEEKAQGFGVASLYNTLAISFENANKWENKNFIEIKKITFDESGELVETKIDVKHIYDYNKLEVHKEYLKSLSDEKYKIDKKIFSYCTEDKFKKIKFCEGVAKSISNLDSNVYNSVLRKLILIEKEVENIKGFDISSEGETVASNPKLRQLRCFKLPDKDIEIYMGMHIKGIPLGNRIHYCIEDEQVYIGYVGKHLETKKF
ncbi:MAG: hypothetical protein RR795_01150 [Cetobacterium sp.]|uniref:hypothetical protein n=1 Tax=Cetobacterium sp. TaxID=2071632 RepID=UPI002FCA24EA